MRTGQPQVAPHPTAPQAARPAQIRLIRCKTQTAWDAVICTLLTPGDPVLVLGSGPVATLWAEIADRAGLVVEVLEAATEASLSRHLGADRYGAIKAVFLAHGDAGSAPPPCAVRTALDACFHDALLLIDASVATAPPPHTCYADIVITDPEAGLARSALRQPIAAA